LATHKQKKYISSTDDDNTEFNIKWKLLKK
jgi:hypothetical protein